MKLPKNYFQNISVSKYKEYLKLLPDMHKESTKAITMLIFTFIAMSFLGIFAINPTLSTIVDLNKQLEDSKFVYEKLLTKKANLINLQAQYSILSNDIPFVLGAIPDNPSTTRLMGQIEALARKQQITIIALSISQVQLNKQLKPDKESLSFKFSLQAEGTYDQLINFSSSLNNFNRLINLESISFIKNPRSGLLVLSLKGKGYFKP